MALLAHYRLDGDARDSVGNNHGTYSSVSWVDGKLGKAGDFTRGPGNGVWIPHDDYLSRKVFGVGTTLSFSFWINLRQYSNHGIVIGKQSGGGYDESTSSVWVTGSGIRLTLGTNEPNSVGENKNITIAPSLNEWHHVAFTANGTTMRAYLDGSLATQESYSFSRLRSENTNDFQIGTPRESGRNEGIDGQIQDVRIYDHALSPREVRDLSLGLISHYPLTKDTLDAAGKNHASNYGALPTQEGHDFNGTDSKVTVPVFKGAGKGPDITLSAWCKPRSAGWVRVVQLGEHNHAQLDLSSGGDYRFYVSDTEAYGSNHSVTESGSQLNKWSHVCGVVSGGNFRLYVDGRLIGENTFPGLSVLENPTLSIGHDDRNSVNFLDGVIRDVRIYATALTSSQVKELYQQRASIDSKGSLHAVTGEVIAGVGPAGLQHVNVTSMDGAYFNSTDSYAYYEDVTGALQPSEISVSAWVNIRNPSSWQHILSLGDELNKSDSWYGSAYMLWISGSNLELILNSSSYRSPRVSLPTNTWFRIGFTFDGGRVKVFVGDSKRSDEAYSSSIRYGGRDIFQLGGRKRYTWYRGGIRDVAIVGRAVSEAEFLAGLGPETEDLIAWLPMRDDTATINSRGRLGKTVSEVGVTRGLVAWYPLVSDTLDYAGVNHAENNGAVLTADGWYFDGSSYISSDTTFETDADGFYCDAGREWSVTQVFSSPDTKLKGVITGKSGGTGSSATYVTYNDNGNIRCRLRGGTVPVLGTAINGQKHAVTITWDGSVAKAYVDGSYAMDVPVGTAGLQSNLFTIGATASGNSTRFNGTVYVVKVHSVALTPEEAAIEAKLALNPETKSAMTQCCLYTRGQIKEVIA